MIRFQKFTVKDIVFLAIMAALMMLCGAVSMPVMGLGTELFGIENMCTAIFYGLVVSLAVQKVRKPGAVTLVCIFVGAIQLIMGPVMFLTTTLSGLIAEIVALALFRGYEKDRALITAATLVAPLGLPFVVVSKLILRGQSLSEVFHVSWTLPIIAAGTVLLSFAGAMLGRKIGSELRRAGKLV